MGRVSMAEGFELISEAMQAKKRLMCGWQEEGLNYTAATLRYATEQKVSTAVAAERVEDMEVLTGVRLERE
jgi:predicted dienelactone hydrolase